MAEENKPAPVEPAMRPGWKTSEFWLASAAMLLGSLQASGALASESVWEKVVGMGLMALASMGYSYARGQAKR